VFVTESKLHGIKNQSKILLQHFRKRIDTFISARQFERIYYTTVGLLTYRTSDGGTCRCMGTVWVTLEQKKSQNQLLCNKTSSSERPDDDRHSNISSVSLQRFVSAHWRPPCIVCVILLGVCTSQQWFWPGSLRLGLYNGTAKQVTVDQKTFCTAVFASLSHTHAA
jgi:hypothetical protein